MIILHFNVQRILYKMTNRLLGSSPELNARVYNNLTSHKGMSPGL